MTNAIELAGVSKMFHRQTKPKLTVVDRLAGRGREEFWALRGLDLRVSHGESVGIEGPNGSGKSTLLKLVAGTMQPTSGTVQVNGRIAPLLQLGAGFAPPLSGRENIFLAASLFGLRRRETAALYPSILEMTGISSAIHDPVAHYSAGMAARLGFALAIHIPADILLLDEVTAVGDDDFQRKCREAIKARQEAGATLLLVSHQAETVRRICGRHVLLREGRIVGDASVAPSPRQT